MEGIPERRLVHSETSITRECRDEEGKRVCCAHPNSQVTTRCPAYRCMMRALNDGLQSFQRLGT